MQTKTEMSLLPNLLTTLEQGFFTQNDYYINLLNKIGKQQININNIKNLMINKNDTFIDSNTFDNKETNFYQVDNDLMEIFKNKLNMADNSEFKTKKVDIQHLSNPYEELNKEDDILFWYFYVLKNGLDKYENIRNKFLEEKKYKIKIVEKIRENKSHLKSFRITLTDIENNLINQKKISLTTFFYLINAFNVNLFYKSKNILFIINLNKSKDTDKSANNLLTKTKSGYILEEKETINLDDYWIPDNFVKPFRSISSYKLDQLKDIFNKLQLKVQSGNVYKKLDYYTNIQNYLIDM
jgi:hypothetical protein